MQDFRHNLILGKWKLDWIHSGFFPEQDLLFERTESDLTDFVFQFNQDGTITYQHTIDECDVGVLTVKDGQWKYENELVRLELRGNKIADYWYWWIIDYEVKFHEQKMRLNVRAIIKNRQIQSIETWEDLIHE